MRNLAIVFCFLLLTLSACMPTGISETAADTATVEGTAASGHLSIQVNDFTLALDAPAAEALEALGTPNSVTEEPSCAFDGMERDYVYDELFLRTYTTEDGEERVCGWWFQNGALQTNEGIGIGSTREQVVAAYGSFTENTCRVQLGSEKLIILLAEDLVYCVQYVLE